MSELQGCALFEVSQEGKKPLRIRLCAGEICEFTYKFSFVDDGSGTKIFRDEKQIGEVEKGVEWHYSNTVTFRRIDPENDESINVEAERLPESEWDWEATGPVTIHIPEELFHDESLSEEATGDPVEEDKALGIREEDDSGK